MKKGSSNNLLESISLIVVVAIALIMSDWLNGKGVHFPYNLGMPLLFCIIAGYIVQIAFKNRD